MRELKFRAWLDEYKQYIYFGGDYKEQTGRWGKGRCALLGNNYIAELYANEDNSNMFYQVHKVECIEQYTGLKDKNGKEIYEGDIIQEKGLLSLTCVEWNKNNARYMTRVLEESKCVSTTFYFDVIDALGCEVIGNIHENPKLLEQEDAKN